MHGYVCAYVCTYTPAHIMYFLAEFRTLAVSGLRLATAGTVPVGLSVLCLLSGANLAAGESLLTSTALIHVM